MIAVCDEDFESFLMLHIYPDRLKTALAEKSIFLKEEVIRIEVLLMEQAMFEILAWIPAVPGRWDADVCRVSRAIYGR